MDASDDDLEIIKATKRQLGVADRWFSSLLGNAAVHVIFRSDRCQHYRWIGGFGSIV